MKFAILRNGSIILPPLPKWPAEGRAFVFIHEAHAAITKHSPNCVFSGQKDMRFIVVPHSALKEVIAWTLRLQNQLGGFISESRDCDDFADAFDCAVSWMAAKARISAAPLVGNISVRQVQSFAGVPQGGGHALNCVMTDQGLYIVEPQNGQACHIDEYPNRASIFAADGF